MTLESRIFDWDDNKAEINKHKHGVTFEKAMKVFDDKFRVERYDDCTAMKKIDG